MLKLDCCYLLFELEIGKGSTFQANIYRTYKFVASNLFGVIQVGQ
jgi:hypothetical protein